jgi:glycerate kinase
MKNVVAIDSFKGSLDTFAAGEAVKEGILQVYDDACVKISPIAYGGAEVRL